MGLISGLGRSPGGRGNGNLLQCSCLENPKDRGIWWGTVHRVAEEDSAEQLATHFYYSFAKFVLTKCFFSSSAFWIVYKWNFMCS